MRFLLALIIVFIGGCEEKLGDSEHWHSRYIKDNCQRCPECCTSNVLAEAADGSACLEENQDKVSQGWSEGELAYWCITGRYPASRVRVPFYLKGTFADPLRSKK